jgi:hypothetical protein
MKFFSGKLAMSVAGAALLTTTAYAQTPNDAVDPGHHAMVHHRMHHAPVYHRHAYHTGTALHAARIYNQAVPSSSSYTDAGTGGFGGQPLYNAAVVPVIDQSGVACLGGRGIGYYPNPVAYGDAAATIESGGQFILDRGYHGCFAVGE